MNRKNIKKLQVHMVTRARKRLQAHQKRNKDHMMVMFVFVNEVENSAIQNMKAREQQCIYPSVIWKSLL